MITICQHIGKGMLLASLFFITNLSAKDFIFNTSALIDQRAYEKINTIGTEVSQKLGVNIYLDVKGDNGIDPNLPRAERIRLMKEKEQELLDRAKKDSNNSKPFVVLAFALDQQYASILMSDPARINIDKDDILDGYVIPLLAAKDKNTLNSKVSAAALNGYAEIGDQLAKSQGIELLSSIGSQGKVASTIWKVFMYTVVLVGILLYIVIIMKERKIKKGKNE